MRERYWGRAVTHRDLVEAAKKWLKQRSFQIVLTEFTCVHNEVPDVVGLDHMTSAIVECKVSRSDFLRDKKKLSRMEPSTGLGNYRFYLCPPDLIKVTDLPDKWGLLYFDGKKIEPVHAPNVGRAGNEWMNFWLPSNYVAERQVLYSVVRRKTVLERAGDEGQGDEK